MFQVVKITKGSKEMYKYLLFDLDGTLTDPKEGITKCIIYALEKNKYEVPDMDMLMKCIGPPLMHSFQNFFGMDEELATKATADYRERFRDKGIYENAIYDGMEEALCTFKNNGFIIALATSKPTPFAKEILRFFNIEKYFDVVYGSEFNGVRETKTDVIVDVLKDLYNDYYKSFVKENNDTSDDLYPKEFLSQCVMIGDRMHDIIGAKNCNIDSIGVEYGYAPEGELYENGATHIVKDIDELVKYLLDK